MATQVNILKQQYHEKSKSASDVETEIAAGVSTLKHIQVMFCFVFVTQQTIKPHWVATVPGHKWDVELYESFCWTKSGGFYLKLHVTSYNFLQEKKRELSHALLRLDSESRVSDSHLQVSIVIQIASAFQVELFQCLQVERLSIEDLAKLRCT
jgi:hypothetical protein